MPFGLDLKSLIIGALFVWFGLPFLMQALGKVSGRGKSAAA